jgi:hypothetical protein
MIRHSFSLLLLFLLLVPAFAQDEPANPPLIAFVNGELFQVENGALVPYTACTPDEGILGQFFPSNDGTRFVMMTWPKIISQALELFGSLGDIPYGQNFWLCDTQTDSLSRILAQPNGDNDFAGDLPTSDLIQGRPVWSPDSTKIAWTQFRFSDSQQSLIIMDFATGEMSEIILDVPVAPFPVPPEAHWTDGGVMLFVFTMDEMTFANVEYLYILDPETGELGANFVVLDGSQNSDFITDRVFVQQEEGLALALRYYSGGWFLMNLETGEQTQMNARLERFSPVNPEGLRLAYDLNAEFSYDWEIVGGASSMPLLSYPLSRVALAPDGTQLAYADASLHIYNADGTITEVANSEGFADDLLATLIWGSSPSRLVPR